MNLSNFMTPMKTPRSRIEMERNSHLLIEQLRSGKLSLPNDFRIKYSLTKLVSTPNRRLDFLSVDEHARLQMNMSAQNFMDQDLELE